MPIRLTTVLALVVLMAGAAGALFFRKAPAPSAPSPPAPTLVLRDRPGPHFLTPSHLVSTDDTASAPAPPLASLTPLDETAVGPPAMEWEHPSDSFNSPAVVSLPPLDEDGAMPEPQVANSVPDEPVLIRHRIVDGDTLAALAERYLGDRSRQQELYETNRDVLRDPDLLPIGQELTISVPAGWQEGAP